MATPLIFDLLGSGPVIRGAEMIREDIDGDGRLEVVTDLAFGTGLLVLDPVRLGERRTCFRNGVSRCASGSSSNSTAGRRTSARPSATRCC